MIYTTNIDAILNDKDFYTKPWVMLGTGPSLDQFDLKQADEYNVLAIYVASQVCPTTIHWCQDPIAYNDLFSVYPKMYTQPKPTKYLATRYINLSLSRKQYHYANEADRGYPTSWNVYPCGTSAATALRFLARSGIEQVKLYGFDGGIGTTSSLLPDTYREPHEHRKTDFGGELKELTDVAKAYSIKLI